jgi:membrane-bound metal-dependent hydrolase YbcI (DUF457 family)
MFAGHFGVGFGAKAVARQVSLGTLFLASQFIDLLWPSLLLLGWETVRIAPGITRVTPLDFVHYPISHSLFAVILWAILFGATYYLFRRFTRGAIVCALLVLSHWLLDALTHRPDLPILPMGDLRVSLGLWNSLPAAIVVEILIFGFGVILYTRATRAFDRAGTIGFWALVVFLLVIYCGNIFGPPPPSVEAITWPGHAQWLLVAWAYWLDRHRHARPSNGVIEGRRKRDDLS